MHPRDLLRPRWLLVHALVVVVAVVCVLLGLWQLRRHDERTTFNETISLRAAGDPVPLADALDTADATYRRVAVRGRYLPGHDVLLQGRALHGRPGNHVLTPLATSSGRTVWVDRGWVPFEPAEETEVHTPEGQVELTGVLFPPERGLGGTPPGSLRVISHIDLERLADEVDGDVLGLYLFLQSQTPAQPGDSPRPVPLPRLDAGQNLSYAGQWFLFAAVAVVGYAVVLRRRSTTPQAGPSAGDVEPSSVES